MPEIQDRITNYEESIANLYDVKYAEILSDYIGYLSKIEERPGAREGIEPLVSNLLDALENGSDYEDAYIALLGRLKVYIHEHLYTFRDLSHSVISGEVSSDEAESVLNQIRGTLDFLTAIKDEENDPVKKGSIEELIDLLGTYQTLIEQGIQNGNEGFGYFQNFVAELEQNFTQAIIAANENEATTQSIRDLLISQLGEIRNLRAEYLREKTLSDAEFQRQRDQSQESLMFEPYTDFGENILIDVFGFYPLNVNTNTPELDIARDKIFDIGAMTSIDQVREYGESLSISIDVLELPGEGARRLTDFAVDIITGQEIQDSGEQNEAERLAQSISYFLQNNPDFLSNFPEINSAQEFKERIIRDYGIALTGSINESFTQLKNQLGSDNSTLIVFNTVNEEGQNESQSIDFSILYSDPTDEDSYIADPVQRLEAQKLARQKSIVSGMVFLQRLQAERPSDDDFGYYFQGIIDGFISIGTLDFINIPYLKEKAENAATLGVMSMSLALLAYRGNIGGVISERARFTYKDEIKELFNTHKNSSEADMTTAGLNSDQITAVRELQNRNAIVQYYIVEAQRKSDKGLETRLQNFGGSDSKKPSKLFFVQGNSYFHKHLQIINESSSFGRLLSGVSRVTTLGAVVNQARRYAPSMPREPAGNLIVRNYRRVIGINWSNLEQYHNTLVRFRFIPSQSATGINLASSQAIASFVRGNINDISDVETHFRTINGNLSEINGLAGGLFNGDFTSAIESHVSQIMNGGGTPDEKMSYLLDCFKEKSEEAKNIRAIFDGDKKINLSQSPELRDVLLRNIRKNIQEINSGAVESKSDYISVISRNSEKINDINGIIRSFNYEQLSNEQNKGIQDYFKQQLQNIVDSGNNVSRGITDIEAKVGKLITGLNTGHYDSILNSFFSSDGTFNSTELRAFLTHRDRILISPGSNTSITQIDADQRIKDYVDQRTATLNTQRVPLTPGETDTASPREGSETIAGLSEQKRDYLLRVRAEILIQDGVLHGFSTGNMNFRLAVANSEIPFEEFERRVQADLVDRGISLSEIRSWDAMAEDLFDSSGEFKRNLLPNSVNISPRSLVDLADIRARFTGDLDPSARVSIGDIIVRALRTGG